MKKFLNYVIIIMLCMIITGNVSAKEIYFENSNGVTFTKEEYDFFGKVFYDGYQEYITEEIMNHFAEEDRKVSNVEYVILDENSSKPWGYNTKGDYNETRAKILKIAKVKGGLTTISLTAQWKYAPNIRSYDIIGAYLSGVSALGSPTSLVTHTGATVRPSATVSSSKGFGSVLKLPKDGANIVVSTTFYVTGNGTVYGSYQHAKSSLSLNNAKSFSISFSGLGNAFYFSNMNIRSKYDAMQGVSIEV